MNAPCYQCPDRRIVPVSCHSHCEKYAEYREKVDQINRARFEYELKKSVSTHRISEYFKWRQKWCRNKKKLHTSHNTN